MLQVKSKGSEGMELTKINGSTYWIKSPTNIGVYTFKDKYCVLIDTGISSNYAKRIDKVLSDNKLRAKYIINTHHHVDHTGGNKYFSETYPGTFIYTSKETKIHLENPEIGSAVLFSGSPVKRLEDKNKYYKVDFLLDLGINKINDEKFNIISLKGHSNDHIGIVTPDKVCFLGDSIFSSDILSKYSFPYLYDIGKSLKTLEGIKEIDADYFVISHAKEVLGREEIKALVEENIKNINNYEDQILEILSQPMTREDLLQNITILNELSVNYKQYHLNFSTLSSFLSYLYDQGLIKDAIEDGKLYYYVC